MHADNARVPEVEDVARVRQLVLVGDGNDVEALILHILAKLDARPGFGASGWFSWVVVLVGQLGQWVQLNSTGRSVLAGGDDIEALAAHVHKLDEHNIGHVD